ncbi:MULTISPECIES: response regulator transcription factor [unclassified Streptomyces]|uniref:response regulator transcription factor n=1 Tax=unclassified Streptomyces TaxID=2593676 RepID=UPI002E14F909|nr:MULTISPECIES: response regulator transcription factor [unclassified Streptomyces]WSQ41304.1 response regulator transcription factor [Streptomyces sp. NBC_01224]
MNRPVRVLLADDQALLRTGFRLLIESVPDLTVAGEAVNGDQAVDLTLRLRPDVVLMDIRMPGTDGLEATRRICADPDAAGTRVLVLTTFDLDEYVYAALRGGASGFLLKDILPADLLTALRVVASGDALLAPTVTRRLIREFAGLHEPRPRLAQELSGVTPREREVLRLVARGLPNRVIAEHLGLSIATVKTHVRRLLAKLHAHDRAQLVVIAYETGLVSATSGNHPSTD